MKDDTPLTQSEGFVYNRHTFPIEEEVVDKDTQLLHKRESLRKQTSSHKE